MSYVRNLFPFSINWETPTTKPHNNSFNNSIKKMLFLANLYLMKSNRYQNRFLGQLAQRILIKNLIKIQYLWSYSD